MIITSILYFLYGTQPYLFDSNRVRGLRNFQCKLNKRGSEEGSEEAKQRILLSKDRRILYE